jgi:hypothetical protein
MSDRHAYVDKDFDGAPEHLPAWRDIHVAIGFLRAVTARNEAGKEAVIRGLQDAAEHLRRAPGHVG